jgi:DNA-3-methyladenine glycosylase II
LSHRLPQAQGLWSLCLRQKLGVPASLKTTTNAHPARLTRESLDLAAAALATRDPHLAAIHRVHGPPPMWARRPGFPTLLRIVLEQQVSLVSARAMFGRLKSNIEPFTAAGFIAAGEAPLRSLGVTRQKAHYCVQVAQAFTNGDLEQIARMKDEDAHAALLRIKGVGPWTANIYLLMALRRADIWPDGDVALASALGRLLKMNARPSFAELAKIAEAWRPYRSVAARMLWQYYLARRGGTTQSAS